MGGRTSALNKGVFRGSKRKASICIIGLDNGGKSTIVSYLKAPLKHKGIGRQMVPTLGFKTESFMRDNRISYTAFDMSGQARYREVSRGFIRGCNYAKYPPYT